MSADPDSRTLLGQVLIPCPGCAALLHAGAAVCPTCGILLVVNSATRQLDDDETDELPAWPMGQAILSNGELVSLHIGQAGLLLPLADSLVIGRASATSRDAPAHIDLSAYAAKDKGVSRRHVLIRRRNYLVFVLDLGSTNGTLLNRRRLHPQREHLLRSGDELQLGQLRVRVSF